jgi:phosphatidylglycerophosphatase A
MTTSHKQAPAFRPDWAFLCAIRRICWPLALAAGLARKAPGTWGTLVAFPLFFLLLAQGPGR